jgi:sugar-specific transcriptional regulator TrmB
LTQSSDESVRKDIRGLGLTDVESKVYIFLAKRGPLKGAETARNVKMAKAQVYHVLKSLQSKGWVHSTAEFPTRFTAVPLAEIIDTQIKLKREEALSIESTKSDLLQRWSAHDTNTDQVSPEKYTVIEGTDKIAVKIFQMIEEAKDEIKILMSGYPLNQITAPGATPTMFKKQTKSQVRMKILTQVTKEHSMIKQNLAKASQLGLQKQVEVRHLADSNFHARCIMTDNKETILYWTLNPTSKPNKNQQEIAAGTNGQAVAVVANALFDKLWKDARDAREILEEIEPHTKN